MFSALPPPHLSAYLYNPPCSLIPEPPPFYACAPKAAPAPWALRDSGVRSTQMTVRITTVKTAPPVWTGSTTTHACARRTTQVQTLRAVPMLGCFVGSRVALRMRFSDILEGGGTPPPLQERAPQYPLGCLSLSSTFTLSRVNLYFLPTLEHTRLSHLPVWRPPVRAYSHPLR